jgi:hypothetical protein
MPHLPLFGLRNRTEAGREVGKDPIVPECSFDAHSFDEIPGFSHICEIAQSIETSIRLGKTQEKQSIGKFGKCPITSIPQGETLENHSKSGKWEMRKKCPASRRAGYRTAGKPGGPPGRTRPLRPGYSSPARTLPQRWDPSNRRTASAFSAAEIGNPAIMASEAENERGSEGESDQVASNSASVEISSCPKSLFCNDDTSSGSSPSSPIPFPRVPRRIRDFP